MYNRDALLRSVVALNDFHVVIMHFRRCKLPLLRQGGVAGGQVGAQLARLQTSQDYEAASRLGGKLKPCTILYQQCRTSIDTDISKWLS